MKNLQKLNLGSGGDYRPGYINIDAMPNTGADIVADITQPLPFKDASCGEVVAQDILEHLTLSQQESVLKEIFRVLAPGGKLHVRIPNIDDIITRFEDDPDTRNLFLYGDTSETGVWGAHKSGHTSHSFTTLSSYCGFSLVQKKLSDTNFEFTLKKEKQTKITSITFINQTLGLGGAESFNSDILRWFSGQGISLTVHTTYQPFAQMLGQKGISSRHIPLVVDIIGDWKGLLKGVFLFPIAILYYGWLTARSKSDIILMSGFIEKILVTPWANLLKKPVVWIEYAPLHPVLNRFLGLPKLLYRLTSRLPEYIIMPTRYTRQGNVALGNISSGRTVLIPCAVNIPPQNFPKPVRYHACCVSRLEPGKGQDLLIRAWAKVIKKVPQAKLEIVGEGDFLPILEALVSRLGLQSSISFLGRVPNALEKIAQSEVFVFPSMWSLEGFGIVTTEAMALSRPVVAFNVGPTPEVADPSTALLLPSGDINALSDAIIKLFSDPALAKKLGKNGRAKYLQSFTFDVVGPQYLHALNLAYHRHLAAIKK